VAICIECIGANLCQCIENEINRLLDVMEQQAEDFIKNKTSALRPLKKYERSFDPTSFPSNAGALIDEAEKTILNLITGGISIPENNTLANLRRCLEAAIADLLNQLFGVVPSIVIDIKDSSNFSNLIDLLSIQLDLYASVCGGNPAAFSAKASNILGKAGIDITTGSIDVSSITEGGIYDPVNKSIIDNSLTKVANISYISTSIDDYILT
jgi:hypothetical protein